jgi:hypothetical protein
MNPLTNLPTNSLPQRMLDVHDASRGSLWRRV